MSALFGALKNKMFGSSASSSAPKEADEDRTPPSSAPTSPQRSTVAPTLAFTPPRPEDAEPAEEFELPQGALDGGSEVARAIVSLYIQAPGRAIEEKLPRTLLLLTKTAPFTYQFKVCSNDKVVIRQPLVSSLTFYFKPSSHTLVWNMSLGDAVHALIVCFASDAEEENFKQFFNLSYSEAGGRAASKLEAGDQRWAIQASDVAEDEDQEMNDAIEYDENEEENQLSTSNYPDSTFEEGASSSIRVGGVAGAAAAAASSSSSSGDGRNDNLAVGQLLNRTFVNRGSQIGVFKHGASGLLEYVNNVPIVRDMDKQEFAPSNMMLYDQDTKMLLLNPNNKGQVYEMDLEYGKVVQEYNAGETVSEIRTLGGKQKYAERTAEQVVLGVNNNTVFSMDPRQSGKNKLAEHKSYKTQTKFSSLATTNAGDVAVGADDGQIRLYNSISKVAKTCLPGLGDAITGMDVTADGSYLLATTKHYLLVIPTQVEGQAKSGFAQSITNKAEAPIKLQLNASDMVQYDIKELDFTCAHFNTGEGKEEFISTSTGPYIITWNFTKIKAGQRFQYKIKRCDSDVVADRFLFGHDDKMVVTLPDNVYMQQMKLKK